MGLKNFFSITTPKIILTGILTFIGIFVFIGIAFLPAGDYPTLFTIFAWLIYFLSIGTVISWTFLTKFGYSSLPLNFIFQIIWGYFISCLIVFIFNKINIEKFNKKKIVLFSSSKKQEK